jgi:hypothetical protein
MSEQTNPTGCRQRPLPRERFKILDCAAQDELAYGKGQVPTLWRETDREGSPSNGKGASSR